MTALFFWIYLRTRLIQVKLFGFRLWPLLMANWSAFFISREIHHRQYQVAALDFLFWAMILVIVASED